ncbi:MAG: NAD-binding protein [Rhizomicrobium sp.]
MGISVFKSRDWFFILPVALVAMVLGLIGFSICAAAECHTDSFAGAFFRTIDLIRGSGHYVLGRDPWQLVAAQLLMPVAFAVTAVKLVIANMRRDLKVIAIRRMRGHAIVCGTGDTGRHIAERLADSGQSVVVIALDTQSSNALACERRGIPVLQGNAQETNLLRMAGLLRASRLFLACGSDAANIEIGLRALAASAKRKMADPIVIMPEMRSEWLYDQVQTHRAALQATDFAHFRIFNLNANAARSLLQSEGFHRAAERAGEAPHLLVIGQGQTLYEVTAQAAQCNFAVPGRRLAVSLVGENTALSLDAVARRYPGLKDHVALKTYENALGDPPAWALLAQILSANPPFAIVIDLQAEERTIEAAVRLRKLLDAEGLFAVPVYPRVWQQHQLGAFLQRMEATEQEAGRLAYFGDLAFLASPDQLLQQSLDLMAVATHRVHRESEPQANAPDWPQLAEMYKQSNRMFADHIPVKLSGIGFEMAPAGVDGTLSENDIEKLAEAEHWRWCVEKRLAGWRHDLARNDMRKHHPLLLDWEALPEGAREDNRRMVRRIPSIVRAAGYSIRRAGPPA